MFYVLLGIQLINLQVQQVNNWIPKKSQQVKEIFHQLVPLSSFIPSGAACLPSLHRVIIAPRTNVDETSGTASLTNYEEEPVAKPNGKPQVNMQWLYAVIQD